MNKERNICGVKVFVSGETYNEYKGTLEEQLEEKDKEIERLNNTIKQLLDYQNVFRNIKDTNLINYNDMLNEINCDLEQENERLNNIIKEALNYIDDNTYYKDHKGHINIDDLYIILQGEDKE